MKVLICDAAKDENGWDGYEGSIPGNQRKLTGNTSFPDECRCIEYESMRDFWWKNRETRVFRCNREDMAGAIAIRMRQLVDNPHVGYSQPNRRGVYEQLQKDPDPSHIRTDVECDCSAAVNACVWATFKTCSHPELSKVDPLARTIRMPEMLEEIQEFDEVTQKVDLSSGSGLKKGDILVIPNCHTAIVWEVEEKEQEEILVKAKTEMNLRIGPGILYQKCKVQLAPDYKIRSYLYKGEIAKVVARENGWVKLEMKGDVYTWYPWVNGADKYVEYI